MLTTRTTIFVLTVAHHPRERLVPVDRSRQALNQGRQNARKIQHRISRQRWGKKKPPSRKVEKPSSPPTAGKQPTGGSFKTRQVGRAQTAGECDHSACSPTTEWAGCWFTYFSCIWKSIKWILLLRNRLFMFLLRGVRRHGVILYTRFRDFTWF